MPTGQPKEPVTETSLIATDLPKTLSDKGAVVLEKPVQVNTKFKEIIDEMKAKGIKFDYKNKETINFLRWEKRLSDRKISELFGVGHPTILRWSKRLGVLPRNRGELAFEVFVEQHPELKVIRRERRVGLWVVRDSKKPSKLYNVDLNAKTCTCDEFRNQGNKCEHIKLAEETPEIRYQRLKEYRREYGKKYRQENREKLRERNRKYQQKRREYFREYKRNRYHSDLEFRERQRERVRKASRKKYSEYREALMRLKLTLGGRCSICGGNDLEVLDAHHPHGRMEKGNSYIYTKEFRDWIKYGTKPDIIFLCVKCHRRIHKQPSFPKAFLSSP